VPPVPNNDARDGVRPVEREEDALNRHVSSLVRQAEQAAREVEQARQLMALHAQDRREAVISLRRLGLSYGDIARRLGCSRSAIQAIVRASLETDKKRSVSPRAPGPPSPHDGFPAETGHC